MKKCPNCNQTFSDDNFFCLDDGTTLLLVEDAGDNSTLFPMMSNSAPTQIISRPTAVASGDSSKWLFLIIGVLATALAGLAIFLFVMRGEKKETVNQNSKLAETLVEEIAKSQESNKQTPEIKEKPPVLKQNQTPAPQPTVSQVQNSPVVSRMRFNKGEITHNETGGMAANSQRVFLLRCRNGQSLSASVYSDNSCVAFDNNSSSLSYVTSAGDNRVFLKNTCGTTRFNLSVTIR